MMLTYAQTSHRVGLILSAFTLVIHKTAYAQVPEVNAVRHHEGSGVCREPFFYVTRTKEVDGFGYGTRSHFTRLKDRQADSIGWVPCRQDM